KFLEEVYNLADLFFVSSRLDAFPNVAIDAMNKGVPVICFENTTGIEEILSQDDWTKSCIVRHLDTKAAAMKIIGLHYLTEYKDSISQQIQTIAKKRFDMEKYVASIVTIAKNIIPQIKQEN